MSRRAGPGRVLLRHLSLLPAPSVVQPSIQAGPASGTALYRSLSANSIPLLTQAGLLVMPVLQMQELQLRRVK